VILSGRDKIDEPAARSCRCQSVAAPTEQIMFKASQSYDRVDLLTFITLARRRVTDAPMQPACIRRRPLIGCCFSRSEKPYCLLARRRTVRDYGKVIFLFNSLLGS
jgi:hypothetical protein